MVNRLLATVSVFNTSYKRRFCVDKKYYRILLGFYSDLVFSRDLRIPDIALQNYFENKAINKISVLTDLWFAEFPCTQRY